MKMCLRRESNQRPLNFPVWHQDRFVIGAVVKLCLKLFQNPVMNNTWKYIYIWLWFCIFMLHSLNVNSYNVKYKRTDALSLWHQQ